MIDGNIIELTGTWVSLAATILNLYSIGGVHQSVVCQKGIVYRIADWFDLFVLIIERQINRKNTETNRRV